MRAKPIWIFPARVANIAVGFEDERWQAMNYAEHHTDNVCDLDRLGDWHALPHTYNPGANVGQWSRA